MIWIIIPAPAYQLWLFSVVVSEWSLWLGMFSIIAIIFSFLILSSKGKSNFWIAPLIISTIALLISLYPFISVLPLAKEQNVSLSFSEYFSGLIGEKLSGINFTTQTFSTVGGQQLQLDIYFPSIKNENNGASIIVIHGGSWNAGNRNDFPQWNKWLAANGFTVFDIDYRIAPQPNFKTAIGDVKCAILWIKENAGEFNIEPDRIALLGRSAGAHLALLAAYTADDSRLPAACPKKTQVEKVRAVISFYAPVDLFWAYDNPANEYVIDGKKTLAAFLGGNPHESDEIRNNYELATPTSHISPNTSPTLIVHGGYDQFVRGENMRFLDIKLKENNIPHKAIYIPYAQHGFDYNFHGWGSQIIKAVMLQFLIEHTRKE